MSSPMRRGAPFLTAVTLMAATAAPATALTADDLWSQWEAYIEDLGYDVTARAEPSGDGLSLRDLTITMPPRAGAGQGGPATVTLDQVSFVETADGSVSVRLPETLPIRMHFEPETGEPVDITVEQRLVGHSITASGTPDDTHYEVSADAMTLALTSASRMGEPIDIGQVSFTIGALESSADMSVEDGARVATQSLNAASLSYDVDVKNTDPEGEGTLRLKGEMTDITSLGGGTLPEGVDTNDLPAALAAGYVVDGTLGYGGGTMALAFQQGPQTLNLRTSSQGGDLKIGLNRDAVVYDVGVRGLTVQGTGSQMPFPLEFSSSALGLMLSGPLVATETDKPFELGLTLADVALPEAVWMMGDPNGRLPHDPLTVRLSVSGLGRFTIDVMDEDAVAAAKEQGEAPGVIKAITLDELEIVGAGAEVTGTGAFEVDATRKSAFGDMPLFFGTADLRLKGVTGLISTLSEMGVIPAMQAMMIGGTIQQMGKQEGGPDDLSARINVQEDGNLTVNDRPIGLR